MNMHGAATTPVTPGIMLIKGAEQAVQPWHSRLLASGALGYATAHLQHEDWLQAYLIAPHNAKNSVHLGSDGIEVLCDGYISAINSESPLGPPHKTSADIIADLYRRHNDNFLSKPRGSYSALIIDKNRNIAFLFNDRRASRPSFYAATEAGTLIISPESRIIAAASPENPDISQASVCEFLISGRYWDDHTLFPSIQKVPQASKLELSRHKHVFSRYWRISFTSTHSETGSDALVDEATHLCQQATERLKKVSHRPFLYLSGGLDSRVVLSCLTHGGHEPVPLVAYGNEDAADNDVSISRQIAEACRLSLDYHPIPLIDWPADAKRASEFNDCIVEVIDAPTLINTWSRLSGKYSSFFNGDECFGWRPPVDSTLGALNSNMMFSLDQVARLKDWITPSTRSDIAQELDHTLDGIIGSHVYNTYTDLRDALYYEERLANEVNANVANQLKFLEQARPLLDEDFLDFVSRLPLHHRTSKQLFASIVNRLSPALSEIPLATNMSIPMATTFSALLTQNAFIVQFCLDELCNISSTLGNFIDTHKIRLIIQAFQDARPLPPTSSDWLSRIPGAWRFKKTSEQNRVHPLSLFIRLLQINFFLKNLENTRNSINRACLK